MELNELQAHTHAQNKLAWCNAQKKKKGKKTQPKHGLLAKI